MRGHSAASPSTSSSTTRISARSTSSTTFRQLWTAKPSPIHMRDADDHELQWVEVEGATGAPGRMAAPAAAAKDQVAGAHDEHRAHVRDEPRADVAGEHVVGHEGGGAAGAAAGHREAGEQGGELVAGPQGALGGRQYATHCERGQLVVADSFSGFKSLEGMVFTSKQHKLIVPIRGRKKSKKSKDGGGYPLELRSLRPHKVLRTCPDKFVVLRKVDSTHFAEAGRFHHETLSVFSTADFESPVRLFPLNGDFQCGQGFLALMHQEEGCFDIVDAVTGTWLLRQPTLSHSSHLFLDIS
ncbi:hypothetical protein Pelo_15651 [Pelomyxa schiedti]|nr:hypothetical protein Pelo_15651 [Pelomyxa schiedti]